MKRALAERYYDAQRRVAMYYQFRDRDTLLEQGITPTQCYALYELKINDKMAMSELAESVGLESSSMTRAVDDMVQRKLVRRLEDPSDRRLRLIQMTKTGSNLLEKIYSKCLQRDYEILVQVDPKSREEVIRAMELLADSLRPH